MYTYADITIFNARYDADTRRECYVPTVIRGVSYLESEGITVNDGVYSTDAVYKIRIPEGATEKAYAKAEDYCSAEDVSGLWTLRKGDYILLGEYDGIVTRDELPGHILTITESADNTIRGTGRVRHWRVTAR